MSANSPLSRIHNQLMWNRLIAVVEEQAQTLIRTAFSNTVREAGDLSAGVFDLEGRMLAQAVTGTPGHVNAMAASVGFFLEKFPIETMREGDIYITNDPWMGTGHLHDFTVVTPAFRRGRAVALFASTSHVVDVGGLGFGPDGRQVYEEGIYLPIMHLAREGVMNETLLEIVRANVREPVQVEGDFYSLGACNDTGVARLLEMMDEFDLDGVEELGGFIMESSHRSMLEEIRALPFGTWENPHADRRLRRAPRPGRDAHHRRDRPRHRLRRHLAHLRLWHQRADHLHPGLRLLRRALRGRGECPEQHRLARSGAGHRPARMHPERAPPLRSGGPPRHRPDAARCGPRLPRARARGPGAGGGHLMPLESGALRRARHRGARRRLHALHRLALPQRRHRRAPRADGLSATAFPSGVRNTPVEINEAIAPIIVWRKEYRQDSGGPGRHRGGTGQVMEITSAEGAPFAISSMFDRITYPARGRQGGAAGRTGRMYTDAGTELRGKGRQPIPAGERLVMEMPGGGGYGDPFERDSERVRDDVRNELVSAEAAARDYGVVLAADGSVDRSATEARRAAAPPPTRNAAGGSSRR